MSQFGSIDRHKMSSNLNVSDLEQIGQIVDKANIKRRVVEGKKEGGRRGGAG
jgi:hypothetical protein